MKRNSIYLCLLVLIAMAMPAITACDGTDDDTPAAQSRTVTASVALASDLATRATDLTIPDGMHLRCIMEVWTAGVNSERKLRQEQLVDTYAALQAFTFEVDNGDYQLLFWANYTSGSLNDGGSIADNHYDTNATDAAKGLTAISLTSMISTDPSHYDAFYGHYEFTKSSASVAIDGIVLNRPFAKVTFKETDVEMFKLCKMVMPDYFVFNSFNVADGSVGETAKKEMHGLGFLPSGNGTDDLSLFSFYIFCPEEGATLGEITLGFTAQDPTTEGGITTTHTLQKRTIPAGIPIKRNHHTIASGSIISEETVKTVNVKVQIDAGWDTPDENYILPHVGDFYYSDGTCSTTIDNTKTCISIIYYVGKHESDTDEYTDTAGKAMTVHGYVVALKDADSNELAWGPGMNCDASTSETDWRGYSNQKQIVAAAASNNKNLSEFPAANACAGYTPFAPMGTSGWFLPSAGQLKEMYNQKDLLNRKFTTAEGSAFNNNYYWSSSETSHNPVDYTQYMDFSNGNISNCSKYSTSNVWVRSCLAF